MLTALALIAVMAGSGLAIGFYLADRDIGDIPELEETSISEALLPELATLEGDDAFWYSINEGINLYCKLNGFTDEETVTVRADVLWHVSCCWRGSLHSAHFSPHAGSAQLWINSKAWVLILGDGRYLGYSDKFGGVSGELNLPTFPQLLEGTYNGKEEEEAVESPVH